MRGFALRTVALSLLCILFVAFKVRHRLPSLGYLIGTGSTRQKETTTSHLNTTKQRHRPQNHKNDWNNNTINDNDNKNPYGSDPFAVFRIWNEYKRQHSVEQLRRELHDNTTTSNNRTFAIAFYSCPLQAGNRLHHFFNSILWAVITNRTVLWKYYDEETCNTFGKGYVSSICKKANKEKDCNQVLERSRWIPSYDEWIVENHTKRSSLLGTIDTDYIYLDYL